MRNYSAENLIHDPIHGYIPFVADAPPGEVQDGATIKAKPVMASAAAAKASTTNVFMVHSDYGDFASLAAVN